MLENDSSPDSPQAVGTSVSRREGPGKLTGRARYIDDIVLDRMIYGITVRSPVQRGRLKGIQFLPGVPWESIYKVTAQDIPSGQNVVALIEKDQPFLATETIEHAQEPILLLAHEDPRVLEEARKRVKLDIEVLTPIADMAAGIAQSQIIKSYEILKGAPDPVFLEDALRVFDQTYETEAQEQLYIEPNGVIAIAHPTDGVTVWGSLQCPYYVQKALESLFALGHDKIRVIQAETGGGFGGKEEYPSILAGHAALLAWKANRPVKMIYERREDLLATTKRHPSRTRIRSAHSTDGRIQALDIDFVVDGGAYVTLSPVVLSRGTIHAAGPYKTPNVRVRGRAVRTSFPPHGAFRGFGAPQSIFALERHLDQVAHALNVAPDEIRRRNFLHLGDQTATGQTLKDAMDLDRVLERALKESHWHSQRERFARDRLDSSSKIRRGMGLATFFHGAGFTGSGEKTLASRVNLELTPSARLKVYASSTEIGQGTNTIFSQIAADAIGLSVDRIDVVNPDTHAVPNSGPTVASRTVMIVGGLVQKAAKNLRARLETEGALTSDTRGDAALRAIKKHLESRGSWIQEVQYTSPAGVEWDDRAYRGEAYATYAWACYVAQVAVDMRTFEVAVEDFVAVQDVGRVINPVLAAGQIEGGVVQAIGFALYEKVHWKNGEMANPNFTNYIIPTSVDVPNIRVFFEEIPSRHGPSGAKGLGELPMDGPGPAILNAIEDATGLSCLKIPLMPEDIERAWREKNEAQ